MPVLVTLMEEASQNLGLTSLSQYILVKQTISLRKVRLGNKSHQEKHYQKPHIFSVDTEWKAVFTFCACLAQSNEYADRRRQGKPGQDQSGWEAVLVKCCISEASNWKFLAAVVVSSFLFVTETSTWQSCHMQLVKPFHQCQLWLVVTILWQGSSMSGKSRAQTPYQSWS